MRIPRLTRFAPLALAALLAAGCGSSPAPESAPPPQQSQDGAAALPPPPDPTSIPAFVIGAADSVSPRPGSPEALYRYRFRQSDPPSDKFQFQDRDLSFYCRPTPAAIHIQVENRQGQPVWIDWERSQFRDPFGRTGRVAHATTTWAERYRTQSSTQIPALQRYSDYVFPMDYLVDPADATDQLHRPLWPEDASAPSYTDRVCGMDLVFLVEGQPRTYSFSFRAASVIPR